MTNKVFDVSTALRFTDGNMAGVLAFRAMLAPSSMDGTDPAAGILKVISEAVLTVHDSSANTTHRSAAVKLLELVARSLELQSLNGSYQAWFDGILHEAERCRQVALRLEHRQTHHRAKEDARFQSLIAVVTTVH